MLMTVMQTPSMAPDVGRICLLSWLSGLMGLMVGISMSELKVEIWLGMNCCPLNREGCSSVDLHQVALEWLL